MKVFKIDGSALSAVENISKIVPFAEQANSKNKTIMVVLADDAITKLLMEAANEAAAQKESYKDKLKRVEQEYLQVVKKLIPIVEQSSVLSRVKKMCNELENICEAVSVLSELSPKIKDRILSYGALFPSYILSAKLQSLQINNQWSDAKDAAQTKSMIGNSDNSLFIFPDISNFSFDVEPVEIK